MERNKFASCFFFRQFKFGIPPEIIRDLLLLLFLWVLAIVLVNPIGNFPLNDDWSWGKAVLNFIQSGKYQPTGWTPMTLISHVLWGALFCLSYGFSFSALRISTLTLGFIGSIALYFYLCKLNYPRIIIWGVCLTLLSNPLYFSQSFTFMTDVSFTVFATIAIIFFLKNLRSGSNTCLIIGTGIACLAILNRQIGLFIVLAFPIAFLMRFGISLKNIARAFMPLSCGIVVLVIFQYWMEATNNLPILYNYNFNVLINSLRSPRNFLHQAFRNVFVALIYLGIILFPLLILVFRTFIKRIPPKRIFAYSLIFIAFSFWAFQITVFNGNFMPLHGNILISGGIGPLTLYDSYFLSPSVFGYLPQIFWLSATFMAILGAGLLLVFALETLYKFVFEKQTVPDQTQKPIQAFLVFCSIGYFFPVSLSVFFDRYLLPLIVIFSLLIVLSLVKITIPTNSFLTFLGFGLLLLFFVYSVLGTHDYLEWNRARWKALNYLTQTKKVGPMNIDGGFEFNGFYLYDPKNVSSIEKSWWWVKNNDYIISFGNLPMYEIENKFSYKKWLPPGNGNIYVLKKSVP